MKPWLFDILACPIDKHYPLKLFIFSYETDQNQLKLFLEIFNERNLEHIKKAEIIKFKESGDSFLVKDGISIKTTPLMEYLNLIIKSIIELEEVYDDSSNLVAKKCLELLNTKIKDKILAFSKKSYDVEIEQILPELYLLNKFKLDTEIKSGLLYCNECGRWFPIKETIPQMLPDEFRNQNEDILFRKTYAKIIKKEFSNQELKPPLKRNFINLKYFS